MQWHYFRKRKHRYPLLFPIPYYSSAYTKKNFGIKVGPVLVFHDGKEGTQHNIINSEGFNKIGNFLFQKVVKEPNLLEKQKSKSRRAGRDFVKWCKNFLLSQKLSKASNKSLRNLLFQYQKWYEKFALANRAWRLFLDDRIGKKINEILVENKYQAAEIQKVNQYLFSPTARSYASQENIDFLKLLSLIKRQKNQQFLVSFSIFQKEKSIYPKFKKLVKKYFWIPWDYMGPEVWDEKFYFHKIKNSINEGIIPEKEITRLNQETETLKRKQTRIIKKLKLSKNLLNLISALQTQVILQDDKKVVTTESHFYLGNLLLEISKRINIPRVELHLLSFEEIGQELLKHNLKNIEEKLRERHKLCLVITDEGKLKILAGKAVLEYAKSKGVKIRERIKSTREIKGTPACLGKVKGRVRILPNASCIKKFKNGEVLVTSMTTPDFISVIKKAIAIITDEGGITCHAAIISREMQKPCIIGTKIATKILRDGDFVEVDADKGIVKKLS